jgi:2-polyprenyl-3-methyl-5-hydroxy-6-metoxy-1,4-benzoquinol methylase
LGSSFLYLLPQKIIMQYLYLAVIGLLLLTQACDNTGRNTKTANQHMHTLNHEQLISEFNSPERDEWQKPNEVLALLGDLKGKTVADIGAGGGYFTFKLANVGAKVIATDIDPYFVDYIDTRKKELHPSIANLVHARICEADNSYLKANEADVVLIVNTYHHIENRVAYLERLQKSLKINGEIVIIDFKAMHTPVGPPKNLRLSESTVYSELQKAGYTNITVNSDLLPMQYIIRAY